MNILVERNEIARSCLTPGITAVIGSGGKTALLRLLAHSLPGTVVLTTTTHIMPFSDYPFLDDPTESEVEQALRSNPVVCIGSYIKRPKAHEPLHIPVSAKEGKTGGGPLQHGTISVPQLSMTTLAALADYVLVEADGSRQLPLKAHAPWEPVIPECATHTIQIVGATGFNKRVRDVVHRIEIFCDLAGCTPDDLATPQRVAHVLYAEHKAKTVCADTLLINQVDRAATILPAEQLASTLRALGDTSTVWATSLAPKEPRTP